MYETTRYLWYTRDRTQPSIFTDPRTRGWNEVFFNFCYGKPSLQSSTNLFGSARTNGIATGYACSGATVEEGKVICDSLEEKARPTKQQSAWTKLPCTSVVLFTALEEEMSVCYRVRPRLPGQYFSSYGTQTNAIRKKCTQFTRHTLQGIGYRIY